MSTIDSETTIAIGEQNFSQQIFELLSDPRSYRLRPSKVECIETHISWVFLTDRYAYKLKKPVRYDFLDFSTPQLRRLACQREVQLNRPLAADVYLGVVPISRDARGRLVLGSAQEVVDWVVKMRRLPAEHALDRRIESGRVVPKQISQLADKLAAHYQQLPPLTVQVDQYRQRLQNHVAGNRRELLCRQHGLAVARVKRAHAAQLAFLRMMPRLLDNRVCDGRIVEGHGDLRPEHVYLNSEPLAIDCIEFNDQLREIDVLDELGFFAMECDFLGEPAIGRQVIDAYCQASGDDPPEQLLHFYKSYRACVRAKVNALRSRQVSGEERRDLLERSARYLELADHYAIQFTRPLLLVVRGLTGTGKSTLAKALAEELGIDLLSTDAIRRELFGSPDGQVDYNVDRYSPQSRQQVYQEMFRIGQQLLAEGLGAVLDGTFLTAQMLREADELAQYHDTTLLIVNCRCPEEVAIRRIVDRQANAAALSEARPDIYRLQQQDEEPVPTDLPTHDVDTTSSLPLMTESVFQRLRPLWTDQRQCQYAEV